MSDTLQLLSIQIGKFGVIFTRKQLLYSVIVMTACLAIYVFILVEEGHNHEIGKSRTHLLILLSSDHCHLLGKLPCRLRVRCLPEESKTSNDEV